MSSLARPHTMSSAGPGPQEGGCGDVSHAEAANYEIVIRGRLGRAMTRWFQNLEVRASGPDETYLVGRFEDQAALQGFLAEVGDLGLELSGVRRLPDD